MYPSDAGKSFGVFANSLQGRFQCTNFYCFIANCLSSEIRSFSIYIANVHILGSVLSLHCITTKYYAHTLYVSVPGTLATIMASLLHCSLSVVMSLSSASFIPVTSCISSFHLPFGRPLLLLPFLHASIIPFSNPSDHITCPKNPSFLLIAIFYSLSPSSTPISNL